MMLLLTQSLKDIKERGEYMAIKIKQAIEL